MLAAAVSQELAFAASMAQHPWALHQSSLSAAIGGMGFGAMLAESGLTSLAICFRELAMTLLPSLSRCLLARLVAGATGVSAPGGLEHDGDTHRCCKRTLTTTTGPSCVGGVGEREGSG